MCGHNKNDAYPKLKLLVYFVEDLDYVCWRGSVPCPGIENQACYGYQESPVVLSEMLCCFAVLLFYVYVSPR